MEIVYPPNIDPNDPDNQADESRYSSRQNSRRNSINPIPGHHCQINLQPIVTRDGLNEIHHNSPVLDESHSSPPTPNYDTNSTNHHHHHYPNNNNPRSPDSKLSVLSNTFTTTDPNHSETIQSVPPKVLPTDEYKHQQHHQQMQQLSPHQSQPMFRHKISIGHYADSSLNIEEIMQEAKKITTQHTMFDMDISSMAKRGCSLESLVINTVTMYRIYATGFIMCVSVCTFFVVGSGRNIP